MFLNKLLKFNWLNVRFAIFEMVPSVPLTVDLTWTLQWRSDLFSSAILDCVYFLLSLHIFGLFYQFTLIWITLSWQHQKLLLQRKWKETQCLLQKCLSLSWRMQSITRRSCLLNMVSEIFFFLILLVLQVLSCSLLSGGSSEWCTFR